MDEVLDGGLWQPWTRPGGQQVWVRWAPDTCVGCGQRIGRGEASACWTPCACDTAIDRGHAYWRHWTCGAVMVWAGCARWRGSLPVTVEPAATA